MTAPWKERPEGGTPFAVRFFRNLALVCGRGAGRLLLLPTVVWFLLRRGPERRASRAYLARVLGRAPTWADLARHLHCFSATILDRAFMLTESFRRFDIRSHGLDELHRVIDLGRGTLLLGSHLGSFEALRVLSLQRPDVQVRVVLDVRQSPKLTSTLNALNPAIAATVIDAGQDGTAIVLAIREALERNAIVALLADRARPGEATVRTDFLGAAAPFPTAPWLIAAALKVPVCLCFGLYRGGNRYDLHFEHFDDVVAIPRASRQAALAQVIARYAGRLEHYARLAPYNWFNFYDFWQHPEDPGSAGARMGMLRGRGAEAD